MVLLIGYIVWPGNIEIGFVSMSARFLNISRVIFVPYSRGGNFNMYFSMYSFVEESFRENSLEKKIFKVLEFSKIIQ